MMYDTHDGCLYVDMWITTDSWLEMWIANDSWCEMWIANDSWLEMWIANDSFFEMWTLWVMFERVCQRVGRRPSVILTLVTDCLICLHVWQK